MVHTLGLLITRLLLASFALARPSGLGGGLARRLERSRSPPNTRASGAVPQHNSSVLYETYNSNWAGAVIQSAPYSAPATSGVWNIVEGTFTVPTPKIPGGPNLGNPNAVYAAAIWVGIDGDVSCPNAIPQTGIDVYINGNGQISYDAWYEWFPSLPNLYYLPGAIKAGDVIQVSVLASTATSGQTILHNLSQRWTVSQKFTAQPALCQKNADWIVEAFEGEDNFAYFDTVTFTNAIAEANIYGTDLIQSSPAAAHVYDIGEGQTDAVTSTTVYSGGLTVKDTANGINTVG